VDEEKKLPGDFLYDGSISSYIWRFVLCFTLGVFLDFILFLFLGIGDEGMEQLHESGVGPGLLGLLPNPHEGTVIPARLMPAFSPSTFCTTAADSNSWLS